MDETVLDPRDSHASSSHGSRKVVSGTVLLLTSRKIEIASSARGPKS